LKCLKGQGLPAKQPSVVFCAVVMSRILYASPAWGRFLTDELIAKFDGFFEKKAVRWGYSCELKCLSDLLHETNAHLFRKMGNNKQHIVFTNYYHPQKFSHDTS